PLPIANAGSDITLCLHDASTLSATGGINYSWSPALGLSNPNIQNPQASPVSTTVYSVTVTDANGCSASDNITVKVNPLPIANAGTDKSICFNNSCTLNASGGINYSWFPTTGLNNPNTSNPVASPITTTSYIVSVSDSNGCIETDTLSITVNPLPVADA